MINPGSVEFRVSLNWRGKALLGVLKIAVLLGKIGMPKTAVLIGSRVLGELARRKDWFDTELVPPR